MKLTEGCVGVSLQIGKKLKDRAEKVRARNCTLAELIRRALAAYVEKREKAGEQEPWSHQVGDFEGSAHSRPATRR